MDQEKSLKSALKLFAALLYASEIFEFFLVKVNFCDVISPLRFSYYIINIFNVKLV